jgi:hypothetical protein
VGRDTQRGRELAHELEEKGYEGIREDLGEPPSEA